MNKGDDEEIFMGCDVMLCRKNLPIVRVLPGSIICMSNVAVFGDPQKFPIYTFDFIPSRNDDATQTFVVV